MKIVIEIIKDAYRNIAYFVESNLRTFANFLSTLLPYVMLFVGQYVYEKRDGFAIGGELFIPVIVYIVVYLIRSYANKIGKGTTIPVPQKRFTSVDDNDEVSIEHNRLQELLLYVADLEDWLERKGHL